VQVHKYQWVLTLRGLYSISFLGD